MEPQVNISFSSSELQALASLLDAAVKATGIQGAKAALPIVAKLEQAVAEANKPKAQEETE